MSTQPGPRKLSAPAYVRPVQPPSVPDASRRIARDVVPTLLEAKGFWSFGTVASVLAIGKAAIDPGTALKDIGGLGGAINDAARANERIGAQARAIAGAAAHAKVAGQIGFELARARVAVSQAEDIVRAFKSPAAESALVFMRPELQKLQSAFESERHYQLTYRKIAAGLGSKLEGASASRLGEFALAAEKVASKSSIGRGIMATGKVLSNPWIAHSLVALGVGIASVKGYYEADVESRAWKVGYGAGAGVSSGVADLGLASAVARSGANPLALLYDPAVKYGAKLVGQGELGDRLTIGTFYEDCSKSIVSLTQAVTTGDLEPMNAAHARLMQGKGSAVLQGYASIGDALSRSGLVDAALTRAAEWQSDVPAEFKTSPSWWSAIKSDANSLLDVAKGAGISISEVFGRSD